MTSDLFQSSSIFFLALAAAIIGVLISPFFSLAAVSIVLVMAIIQIQKRLRKYPPTRRKINMGFLVLAVTSVLGLVSYAVVRFVNSISHLAADEAQVKLKSRFVEMITPIKQQFVQLLSESFPTTKVSQFFDQKVTEFLTTTAEYIANSAVGLVVASPTFLLLISFLVFCCYWLGTHYHNLHRKAIAYAPLGHVREKVRVIWDAAEESSYTALVTTGLVAMVQSSIVGIAALVVGLESWPIYFACAFISSFFPVVGLLPIVVIGAFHCYQAVGSSAAVIFFVVGCVSMLADNVLRVLFMGDSSKKVNQVLAFFSIIGAIYVFGIAGLILGPFFISFASALFEAAEAHSEKDL
jgi:predicted PurR-regulated permease PerM